MDQLTRCAAVDLAKDGIRVNAINPGVIVTQLQRRGGLNDEQYEAFLRRSIEVTKGREGKRKRRERGEGEEGAR